MRTALVVGSGPSGATVARVLARSGQFMVTVLEKGPNLWPGLGGGRSAVDVAAANDEVGDQARPGPWIQDPILEPRSFRTAPSDGARAFVGDVNNLPSVVGGGSVHYDAKARRFREVDFVTNTLMGGTADRPAIPRTTYADWPMEYRHLEPFYAVAEELIGVQGPAFRAPSGKVVNPNPNESWRSTPFPMPPGVGMYTNLFQADAARRLGHHPAPVPTAVNSRPYRGRPACNDCAFCLDFACTINAKGGGVWVLDEAMATGRVTLLSGCRATRLHVTGPGASGRRRIGAVDYLDADGALRTLSADVVVLASSPIEAVRLALHSGIGTIPDEKHLQSLRPSPTDPAGLLGRNLMFHYQTNVIGIFNEDVHGHRGRTSTHTLDDFAGAGPDVAHFDPAIPRAGIVELGGNINPVQEATEAAAFAYGARHTEWMRLSPVRRHLAAFTMQGEDMPQLSNYVDLDPEIVDVYGMPVPRVTYRSHPYEIAAGAFYLPTLLEIMQAVGGPGSPWPSLHALLAAPLQDHTAAVVPGQLAPVTSNLPFPQVPQSKHIMGTHRMSLDPEHGVCTPYGRHWAFDNLFHAGGGLFVTAPGFNVTLTMAALSYWVGAAIVSGVADGDHPLVDADAERLVRVLTDIDAGTMAARAVSARRGAAPSTRPSTRTPRPAPASKDTANAATAPAQGVSAPASRSASAMLGTAEAAGAAALAAAPAAGAVTARARRRRVGVTPGAPHRAEGREDDGAGG